MIHNTLDLDSEPMLTPKLLYGKHEKICDLCIITFSQAAIEWALGHLKCQEVAQIRSANGDRPIYVTDVGDFRAAFYMTYMSSPEAAGCLEEARCLIGAGQYIMFGACGSLDNGITEGRVIVPDYAYRDEGLSYHYLAPEEYIKVENADKVADFMERNGISYVVGKTWTTDAIFRETKNKVERLRQEGCIAVEMECSAVQAVCNFYGLKFYNFLFAGDFFEPDGWNQGALGGKPEMDLQVRCMQIAFKLAEEILTKTVTFNTAL